MNNNRNQLNTGNKAFSLEEHSYHFKICNFEKELLLIPIERLRIADGKKHLSYQKEKDSSKKGKFIGKIDWKLSSHTG